MANVPENGSGGSDDGLLRGFIESVAGAMKANVADTLGFGSKAYGDAGGVRPDGE